MNIAQHRYVIGVHINTPIVLYIRWCLPVFQPNLNLEEVDLKTATNGNGDVTHVWDTQSIYTSPISLKV